MRILKFTLHILIIALLHSFFGVSTTSAQEYRDMEGFLNNPNKFWGASFTPVANLGCHAYADSISSPAGPDRPNARFISNNIFGNMPEVEDSKGISAYCWAWGQFIDHDITLSPDNSDESMDIHIPIHDPYFDPNGTGNSVIPMHRSDYDRNTGTTKANPRVHYNAITAFIDGSAIYGADSDRAQWLRAFIDGKLKTSSGNLLPYNTIDGEYKSSIDTSTPEMAMPFPHVTKFFVAGDVRANENPFLTSLHTVFMREHNRLCEFYSNQYPQLSDENLYQKARKAVGGMMQAIVYEEWLPTMGIHIEECSGYNQWVNPSIRNSFSASAYRYGHATITPMLMRMNSRGRVIDEGNIALRDAFFNPDAIVEAGGIDAYLNGMSTVVQQDVDCHVIDDLRNFLFGPPGAGGLDLVSLNINRGRDRGLHDFNTMRKVYGLTPYVSFDEISTNSELVALLEKTYVKLELIDSWVGMLAEDHVEGSMFGQTAKRIIEEQFSVLREGDKYYYEFDPFLGSDEIAEIKSTRLSHVIARNTDAEMVPEKVFIRQSLDFLAYRTIDGRYNNEQNTKWGATESEVVSGGATIFSDGVESPSGSDRPNPRLISNIIFSQDETHDDPGDLSAYAWGWGQFIDHDVTLSPDHPTERMDIAVPKYDIYFDPDGTGQKVIPMNRSDYDPNSGKSIDNPREYINAISSYIDASNVYGSDDKKALWLRTFKSGKLKASKGNLLPYNTLSGEYSDDIDPQAPEMAMPFPHVTKYFVAGDLRANENPFLTSFHTIFLREHNRVCDLLVNQYPEWTDEKLYQIARKHVGATIQSIVYEEWLPALGVTVEPYIGYNTEANPAILNVFSTAAFRYGHTNINGTLMRMDEQLNELPEGHISLKNAFFNPDAIPEVEGIEPYLIGMSTVVQQDMDCYIIDDLRNFLFGAPGNGGLDLAALNINRGRDRGLIDFNSMRQDVGYAKVKNFKQMTSDLVLMQKLAVVYQDIDKIDPWVGFLAEDHKPGSIFGETAGSIIEDQFQLLRDGDRYYYENDTVFTASQISEFKNTLLSDVIRRNTDIYVIQDSIFRVSKLKKVTKTKEHILERKAMDIGLFPNPATSYVTIDVENGDVLNKGAFVEIIDMNGFVVQRQELDPSNDITEAKMDLNPFMHPGLYIMRVQNSEYIGLKSFFVN